MSPRPRLDAPEPPPHLLEAIRAAREVHDAAQAELTACMQLLADVIRAATTDRWSERAASVAAGLTPQHAARLLASHTTTDPLPPGKVDADTLEAAGAAYRAARAAAEGSARARTDAIIAAVEGGCKQTEVALLAGTSQPAVARLMRARRSG